MHRLRVIYCRYPSHDAQLDINGSWRCCCAQCCFNCNSRSGSRIRHSKMFDGRTARRIAPTRSDSWFIRRRHYCSTCCSFCSDHSFCCGKLPGALAFSSCALNLLGLILARLSSGTDSCSVLAMSNSRLLGAVNECVAGSLPWVIPGRGHLLLAVGRDE